MNAMTDVMNDYIAEMQRKATALKCLFDIDELVEAFDTLSIDDSAFDSSWTDATKAVWTTTDELYVEFADKFDDDNEDFCGTSIMFDDLEPICCAD